jgi:hypothetical protein
MGSHVALHYWLACKKYLGVHGIRTDATTEEGQPTETVKEEEEMEQTLMSTPTEGDEHSTELLKIFSQEAEQEMTAALEPATERGSRQHRFC